MPRYFLEVAYKGTRYSGFQIQENARTIQYEVEKALKILFSQDFQLTGSSRTDAGVHAKQNYFHFDTDLQIPEKQLYHLNAILPADIAVRNIAEVKPNAHCRFDAVAREYEYYIYQHKDPFKEDRAWFYPYQLSVPALKEVAALILQYRDFTSFAKRNSQVNNFLCAVEYSSWQEKDGFIIYTVKANRFLRGMVRGLVGTMVKTARNKITIEQFKQIIEAKDCTKADFSTPPQGLFLSKVVFP
jgi:tRNA pseudouridine38-40 synthase